MIVKDMRRFRGWFSAYHGTGPLIPLEQLAPSTVTNIFGEGPSDFTKALKDWILLERYAAAKALAAKIDVASNDLPTAQKLANAAAPFIVDFNNTIQEIAKQYPGDIAMAYPFGGQYQRSPERQAALIGALSHLRDLLDRFYAMEEVLRQYEYDKEQYTKLATAKIEEESAKTGATTAEAKAVAATKTTEALAKETEAIQLAQQLKKAQALKFLGIPVTTLLGVAAVGAVGFFGYRAIKRKMKSPSMARWR